MTSLSSARPSGQTPPAECERCGNAPSHVLHSQAFIEDFIGHPFVRASVEGTTPPSLRELAERATPGPWTAGRADMQSFFASTGEPFTNVYAANPDPDGPVHMGERLPFVVAHVLDESERNKDDAAYIAAANPAAILALYAEIDAKDAWHESELAGCRMERLASDAVIAELRSALREAQEDTRRCLTAWKSATATTRSTAPYRAALPATLTYSRPARSTPSGRTPSAPTEPSAAPLLGA